MRRVDQPELLDQLDSAVTPEALVGNLADLARINRLLGTRQVISQTVWALIDSLPAQTGPITILDVGAATADLLSLLHRQADHRKQALQTLALEHDSAILACLRSAAPQQSAIGGDALALPIASHSVDIVICAQMIHHLTPIQVARALGEFQRVAKYGVIVFDLDRSRLALIGAVLLTRLLSRNRLTRHDGVLSVRRAYHPAEIQALTASVADNQSGQWHFRRIFPFRWLAVYAVRAR